MRLGDVSGVAAVANGEVERAGAGNGDDGCSALRWLLAAKKEAEAKRKWSAAGVGRTLAGLRPRPGASWPARTERWRRAAVSPPRGGHGLTAVGHCTFAIQFIRRDRSCVTASLHGELAAKPNLQRASDLHDLCSPMYQLQLWFKYLVLIRNRDGVISSLR